MTARRARFEGYAFIAPTAALLVCVALAPIGVAVWLSFRRVMRVGGASKV